MITLFSITEALVVPGKPPNTIGSNIAQQQRGLAKAAESASDSMRDCGETHKSLVKDTIVTPEPPSFRMNINPTQHMSAI